MYHPEEPQNPTPNPQPNPQPEQSGRLTKHELRAQRREERKAEQRAHDTKRTTKRVIMWVCIIVVLGLIVWGMYAAVKGGPATPTGPVPGVNEVTSDDHVFGKADAAITLVEYGDFQCPACGAYYPIVKQVKGAYQDTIRIVFRGFPLPQHQNARLGARAAEAASVQGKFWEMHDQLYEHQSDWSELSDAKARAKLEGYAKDIGLNVEQFKTDIDASGAKAKVDKDQASGVKAGVNSTPTFFLNGSKIDARSYDDFKKLLDAAIKP